MPDFYQTGIITTLHYLGTGDVTKLERELVEDSAVDPIALVIPSLASEMEGPALAGIVKELTKVPYLNQVVTRPRAPARGRLPGHRAAARWQRGAGARSLAGSLAGGGARAPGLCRGRARPDRAARA
jgi:hypothetical protein